MKLSCDSSEIKWSSRVVECDGWECTSEGNKGEERKTGSFMISQLFFGGGETPCVVSGGVWIFEGVLCSCYVVQLVLKDEHLLDQLFPE